MSEGVTITFDDEHLEGQDDAVLTDAQGNPLTPAGNGSGGDGGDGDGDNPVVRSPEEIAASEGISVEELNYAKKMGWVPKESFRGNPKDHKGASEFIRIAEESGPVLRERNREMAKKLEQMQKMFPTMLDLQKKQLQGQVDNLLAQNKDLEKQLEEAHLLSDSKRASEITEKIMENKIKAAITTGEVQKIGADGKQEPVTSDGIDKEREIAWRDDLLPRLTLEQRERYAQAAQFVALPQNADQTTDQRIAYIESRVFGRPVTAAGGATPARQPLAAAPVMRQGATATTDGIPGGNTPADEFAGWNALSDEEKKAATAFMEYSPWWETRHTDPESIKEFNKFKKNFNNKEA